MKDIELVIKIPERIYNTIMSTQSYIFGFSSEKSLSAETLKAIRTGIPLPKGHGALIDKSELPIDIFYDDISEATVIIPSDKESEE